jgi:NarL family two-component system response regulator LiaR
MSSNKNIRLLIAAHDERLREALVVFFGLQDEIEVIGQAANLEDARSVFRQQSPDVLLLDMDVDGHDPAAIIRALHQADGSTKIIALSSASDDLTIEEMLEAGAARYVEKGVLASEILAIIRQIQ